MAARLLTILDYFLFQFLEPVSQLMDQVINQLSLTLRSHYPLYVHVHVGQQQPILEAWRDHPNKSLL